MPEAAPAALPDDGMLGTMEGDSKGGSSQSLTPECAAEGRISAQRVRSAEVKTRPEVEVEVNAGATRHHPASLHSTPKNRVANW